VCVCVCVCFFFAVASLDFNLFHFFNGLPLEFAVAAFDLVVMAEKKPSGSIPVDLCYILLLTIAERSLINVISSPTQYLNY